MSRPPVRGKPVVYKVNDEWWIACGREHSWGGPYIFSRATWTDAMKMAHKHNRDQHALTHLARLESMTTAQALDDGAGDGSGRMSPSRATGGDLRAEQVFDGTECHSCNSSAQKGV